MSDNGAHDWSFHGPFAGPIMPHLRKVEGIDGLYMGRNLGHGKHATIYFTIPKDHIFQFWVSVSTEANYDYLKIYWKAFGDWVHLKSLSGLESPKRYWSFRSGVTVDTDTVVKMTYSKDWWRPWFPNGGNDQVLISGFLTKFTPTPNVNIKQSSDFSSQIINHYSAGHWIDTDEMSKADGTVWGNY